MRTVVVEVEVRMTTLDELRALEAKATKGPWEGVPMASIGTVHQWLTENDRDFILAARNALPALIEVAEAAKNFDASVADMTTRRDPKHRATNASLGHWLAVVGWPLIRRALARLEGTP